MHRAIALVWAESLKHTHFIFFLLPFLFKFLILLVLEINKILFCKINKKRFLILHNISNCYWFAFLSIEYKFGMCFHFKIDKTCSMKV